MEPEIANALILSTGHLHVDDCKKFSSSNNVIRYDLKNTGWLVWVSSDDEYQPHFRKLSNGFLESYKLAKRLGCSYIIFHRDGPIMDNLPSYDW